MQKGIVKKVTENGFGFILPEGAEKDIFFHANEVNDGMFNSLKEGDAVTFEIGEGKKGPNAINVSKVDGAAPAADVSDDTMSDDTSADMADESSSDDSDTTEESTDESEM